MRCRRSSLRRRQSGAALVMAMLVFALCAALVVAMKSDFERVYQRGGNLFLAEQARAYLHGAEGLANLALVTDYELDQEADLPRDTLDEIWAQEGAPYPLEEGGWLVGRLEDLQGRFNLNHLESQASGGDGVAGPRLSVAQAQFVRLLLAVAGEALSELDAIAITEAVGDWIDPNPRPRLDGAEDDYYSGLTPPYRAANRPMASVSELRAVKGMTPELYQALEPWVTVWPQRNATLNIHTAPALLLRTLRPLDDLRPLSVEEGQALVQYRCENGFKSVDDLLSQPVFEGDKEAIWEQMGGLMSEKSKYFLLHARVEVAGRMQRLYSVLQREGRQVTVIQRIADERAVLPEPEREEICETSP